MKKLLGMMVLCLSLSGNVYAEWLVIVKNKIDENIFIKRKKYTEVIAIEEALKGCQVIFKYREDIKKKRKLELIEACYVYSVIEQ